MAVTIQPAANYAGILGRYFGHVEIAYALPGRGTLDVPDGSALSLTEFGLVVVTPDESANRFLPWSAILEIRTCAEPDDGQMHD
jgi:hypothetical protein